jgi:hypothetical protein
VWPKAQARLDQLVGRGRERSQMKPSVNLAYRQFIDTRETPRHLTPLAPHCIAMRLLKVGTVSADGGSLARGYRLKEI